MMVREETFEPASRIAFDDGRGRFPDRITAAAPIGMRADIRRAASLTGMTAASFIRDAIDRHVRTVLSEAHPHV